MKLPSAAYKTGVQSLGRQSVYGPLREAEAITQALNISQDAAQAIYRIYDERRTLIETEEASLLTQHRDNTLRTDLARREYFSADEIPEDLPVRRTEIVVDERGVKKEVTRKEIPAYEVAHDYYRHIMESVIEGGAHQITNKNARRRWTAKRREILQDEYAKMALSSLELQKKQIFDRQMMNIQAARKAKQWTLANELAQSLLGSQEERDHQLLLNSISRETDMYENHMATDNIEALYADLEFLQNEEVYQEKGHLDEKTRRQYVEKIKSYISTLVDRNTAADKTALNLFLNDVRKTTEALENNRDISIETITQLFEQGANFPEHRVAVPLTNLGVVAQNRDVIGKFSRRPAHIRQQTINELGAVSKTWEEASLYTSLVNAHETATREEQNDPWTRGITVGTVATDEAPPLDYQNLGQSLADRIPLAQRIHEQLGTAVMFGSKEEMAELSSRFNEADFNQQMAMIKDINDHMGDVAPYLYDSLNIGGMSPMISIAGEALSEGDTPAGTRILRGRQFLQTKEADMFSDETRLQLEDFIRDRIGGAYVTNPERTGAIISAARASYAWQVYTQGDPLVWDEDLAEKALHDATGGLYNHGEYIIELPRRDMSGYEFRKWMKGLHHTALETMGKPDGITNKQLLDGIVDEDYGLVNAGHGMYYVIGPDGRAVKEKGSDDLFLFFYTKVPYSHTKEGVRETRREEEMAGREINPPRWPNLGTRMRPLQ